MWRSLIATDGLLEEVLDAAEELERARISCRVISLHTLKPVDKTALLAAARETGGIVSVEEHTIDGGLGGLIAETLLDEGVAPEYFARIGLRAGFSSIVGSQKYLRERYGLDAASIAVTVRNLLGRKKVANRNFLHEARL